MVIQIEESRERAKEMDGKYARICFEMSPENQECIDDCMRARKADATYMKPILRQAKCHERLADFTAACACYTVSRKLESFGEGKKKKRRTESSRKHAKRLKIISDVTYLTDARRALRRTPINGGESFVQNELLVKSAITDATDIEGRATHMPLDTFDSSWRA